MIRTKTKIINLFGAPSAGKSTTAAGVFHRMKLQGINCELVTEHAKQMVWREMNEKAFKDQLYITAKQHSYLSRCFDKVDYVVTDSPLLLALAYLPENYFSNFEPLVLEIFNSYENINFYLKRTKPYNPIGRNQDEAGSDAVGEIIHNLLVRHEINFSSVDGDEYAPTKILRQIQAGYPLGGGKYIDHPIDYVRPLIFDPEHYPEDREKYIYEPCFDLDLIDKAGICGACGKTHHLNECKFEEKDV